MEQIERSQIPPYAAVLVKLLQGVIYEEDRRHWQELITFQQQVREYFAVLGTELHLNEQEGFAFLAQPDEMDGEASPVPRLVRRMPLSYEITLLLVVLREVLEEFDLQNTDSRRCFITNQDLKDRIEVFFEERSDRIKLLDKLDQYINQAVNLGFLKEVEVQRHDQQIQTYELRRIVKAKITSEKLEEIKDRLKST